MKSCYKTFLAQLFYSPSSHWCWTFWQVNIFSIMRYMLIDTTTGHISLYIIFYAAIGTKRNGFFSFLFQHFRGFWKPGFCHLFSGCTATKNHSFSHVITSFLFDTYYSLKMTTLQLLKPIANSQFDANIKCLTFS